MKIEPAHHCLKSRGLSISRRVTTAGTLTGTVAATTHQIAFKLIQPRLKSLQRKRLSIRTNLRNNRAMQLGCPARTAAMAKALMQFPDSITEPGELEGTQFNDLRRQSLLKPDPVAQAANWVNAVSRSFTR